MDKEKQKKVIVYGALSIIALLLITLSCISIYNGNHYKYLGNTSTECSIDNCPIPNTNKTCNQVINKTDGLYCNIDNITE